jgi:hypothetical protein
VQGSVNSALNFRDAPDAEKILNGLTTGGLSSSPQLHRVSLVENTGLFLRVGE